MRAVHLLMNCPHIRKEAASTMLAASFYVTRTDWIIPIGHIVYLWTLTV